MAFQEVYYHSQCRHRNISTVIAVFLTEHAHRPPKFHIVLELLLGETMKQRLRRVVRFTPVDASKVAFASASALAYLSARGIVHRDIKPGEPIAQILAGGGRQGGKEGGGGKGPWDFVERKLVRGVGWSCGSRLIACTLTH